MFNQHPPRHQTIAHAPRLSRRTALARLVGAGTAAALLAGGIRPTGGRAQGQATPTDGTPAATPVPGTPVASLPTTFVLVHGAFLGGWSWDALVPYLTAAGHTVIAPDLPGHGADTTPVAEISLQAYVDRIVAILDAQPAPVILVGHSAGGITISQVAEARPEKVAMLVYVAAYLLPSGETLFAAATADVDSQLGPNLIIDEAQGVMSVKPEAFAEIFYHDIPAAVAAPALARSQPEPLAPLATPLATTAARFGSVRRVYIETRLDRVVSPVLQQEMVAALPGEQVLTIETGHAPFLAQPEQLAALLLAL